MSGWQALLCDACAERTLERARSAVGQGVSYDPGQGGADPTAPLGDRADSSGFIAWALGIPRELPPGSQRWLKTTAYWEGGGVAGPGLFAQVAANDAAPGDLLVYPELGGNPGRIGVISAVAAGRPAQVIHCSRDNYSQTGDAIGETGPDVFIAQPATRVMRVDYHALRALFGLAEPGQPPAPEAGCVLRWDGSRLYARLGDGPEVYVAHQARYGQYVGLANGDHPSTWRYDPAEYVERYGYWAQYLEPTALGESNGRYCCVNTYDLGRFTFGFLQFAAHTPDENLVTLLRALLALPQAARYFPDLTLVDGRIARVDADGVTPLETAASTAALTDYLNPSLDEVEELEAQNAARLVHWCENDPQHRQTQVWAAVDKFKRVMPQYAKRYALDGRLDAVCVMVFDIRHQGRASSKVISEALDTGGDDARALENLLQVGAASFAGRLKTLRGAINRLAAQGVLGARRYSLAENEFR